MKKMWLYQHITWGYLNGCTQKDDKICTGFCGKKTQIRIPFHPFHPPQNWGGIPVFIHSKTGLIGFLMCVVIYPMKNVQQKSKRLFANPGRNKNWLVVF